MSLRKLNVHDVYRLSLLCLLGLRLAIILSFQFLKYCVSRGHNYTVNVNVFIRVGFIIFIEQVYWPLCEIATEFVTTIGICWYMNYWYGQSVTLKNQYPKKLVTSSNYYKIMTKILNTFCFLYNCHYDYNFFSINLKFKTHIFITFHHILISLSTHYIKLVRDPHSKVYW